MVWGLKAVILSGKAPMPCYLICVFGPSDFPAAVILNFDVVFPVPSKLLHGKMATKELLVPNLLASCRKYSNDSSESSYDKMQLDEDESSRFKIANW